MATMVMTAMIEAASAVRIPSDHHRAQARFNWEDYCACHISSRTSSYIYLERSKCRATSCRIRTLSKNRIRASMESTGSNPSKVNGSVRYHPFEEIGKLALDEDGDARLTAQETARTIVEVNKKATLMLTGLISDEIHENIIWPDLPYVTDDYGNMYFQVKNDEDILQSLTSETNFVHAIIGFDAMEMISEMELLESSEIEIGIEEIEDEENDDEDNDEDGNSEEEDDYDDEYLAVLRDDEEDDSDESLGDWAKLETMRSSHPMHFAKRLTQAATDDPIDWMAQPPSGLAVQGLIRRALSEEHSDIQRRMSSISSCSPDIKQTRETVEGNADDCTVINDQKHQAASSQDGPALPNGLDKFDVPTNGTSFYKLEMTKIQIISAHGTHETFEVEDFKKAKPDIIALSAANIISRVKVAGEKMTEAFKSLCWRCKGIQVEEVALISIDSLGFDLRVCSGPQIQSLRFAFSSRATSECAAEKLLNDLLFPKNHHSKRKHARQQ